MTQNRDAPLEKKTHATKKLQGLIQCVDRTPSTPGDLEDAGPEG